MRFSIQAQYLCKESFSMLVSVKLGFEGSHFYTHLVCGRPSWIFTPGKWTNQEHSGLCGHLPDWSNVMIPFVWIFDPCSSFHEAFPFSWSLAGNRKAGESITANSQELSGLGWPSTTLHVMHWDYEPVGYEEILFLCCWRERSILAYRDWNLRASTWIGIFLTHTGSLEGISASAGSWYSVTSQPSLRLLRALVLRRSCQWEFCHQLKHTDSDSSCLVTAWHRRTFSGSIWIAMLRHSKVSWCRKSLLPFRSFSVEPLHTTEQHKEKTWGWRLWLQSIRI